MAISISRVGECNITLGVDDWVEAKVRGSRKYSVTIGLEPAKGLLQANCNCPYLQEYAGVCKHIWATLVAAEQGGHLQAVAAYPWIRVQLTDHLVAREQASSKEEAERASDPMTSHRLTPWEKSFAQLRRADVPALHSEWERLRTPPCEIYYVIDLSLLRGRKGRGLPLRLYYRELTRKGAWGRLKQLRMLSKQIETLVHALDRDILGLFLGVIREVSWSYEYQWVAQEYWIEGPMLASLLPLLTRTGRFSLHVPARPGFSPAPLQWDEGGPWDLALRIEKNERKRRYEIQGALVREGEEMPLTQVLYAIQGGWVFMQDKVARYQDKGDFQWLQLLMEQDMYVPVKQRKALFQELFRFPVVPRLLIPDTLPELKIEEISVAPTPFLHTV